MAGEMTVSRSLAREAEARKRDARRQDDMLSMTQMVACSRDVHQRYRNILGTLSLSFENNTDSEEKKDRVQEERSASPVSEGVKATPTSLADLCQQLQHRIKQQAVLLSASLEDQQALAAVMTSELGLIWQELKGLMGDPTLTQEENKRLHSETFSEVLRVCEQLYLSYLHLLDTLRRRAVFSDQANRSRLGAQMAMDCTNLLNVHSIRRNITVGIKASQRVRLSAIRQREELRQQTETHSAPHKLDLCLQAKSGRKNSGATRPPKTPMERDLSEMNDKMGELDLDYVYGLMPCHLEQITNRGDTRCGIGSLPSISRQEEDQSTYQRRFTRLKGCCSMPDLQRETLLEELEMEALPARPQSPLVLLAPGPSSSLGEPVDPADDLRRLLQDRVPLDKTELTDPEADLPPLIKALTGSSSIKLQQLRQTLQRLTEEEERQVKSRVPVEKPEHPQAAVVSVPLSHRAVARTAAARVSDRVFLETINIQMYPPVYNDLIHELELSSVKWLDRNLFAGAEIKEVYKELSKSISTQHLNFDEDPMIEPVLTNVRYTLKRKNHERFINPELKRLNTNAVSHKKRTEIPADHKRPRDVTSRAYTAWLQWWKTNLSLDDYLRYISIQDSDYLSAVFHLYDSDDSDDDEDERRRLLQLQREEKKKRRREKIEALKQQKQEYVTGVWNVNAVLLGGLWKEPVLEEEESPDEDIAPSSKPRALKKGVRLGREASGSVGAVDGDQLQGRLERIWSVLCLPDGQRLDMAIKYSSHAYRDQLEEATAAWERAARLIQQRESVLSRLELFEREASDPNRFFQHGYRGTALARMDESKHREKMNSQIAALDKLLSKTISQITERFNDTVTYKGRPYNEKMRWDRIEMLYWLQQERRVQALERVLEGRGALPARLPPLDHTQRAYPGTHPTPQGFTPPSSERPHQPPNTTELCISCTSISNGNK